jgi:predicted RNA methylase
MSPLGDTGHLGPWIEGDDVVDVYDAWAAQRSVDTEGAIDALAEMAGDGPVLELAIGTGRLALPLLERGLDVHGIDASEEMVAKLRSKPGGDRIPVTIGDLADVGVDYDGRYRLIFVVFNTLFGLRSRSEQRRTFTNVARRLTDDGLFVIEGSIPDLTRFENDERSVERTDLDGVTLVDVSRHDRAAQRIDSEHILMRADGVTVTKFWTVYAYSNQMDAMAADAGLRLRGRSRGWRGQRYRSEEDPFVAVYERATRSQTY